MNSNDLCECSPLQFSKSYTVYDTMPWRRALLKAISYEDLGPNEILRNKIAVAMLIKLQASWVQANAAYRDGVSCSEL